MTGATWATRPPIVLIVAGSLLALALLAGAVWAAIAGIRQISAAVSLAAAVSQQQAAAEQYAPAVAALEQQREAGQSDLDLAEQVSALATGLVTPETAAAFTAATGSLAASVGAADEVGRQLDPVVIDDYSADALEAAADDLREQTAWYLEEAAALGGLADRIPIDRDGLDAAADSLFASAGVVEPGLEAASWVAPVDPKLEVRTALEIVTDAELDRDGVAALQAYADAVAAMAQAHEAELATFAGPLYDNKVAALAFANSISGGVLLEFDWVPELFGFGSGFGMAAQASLEGGNGLYYSRIDITENAAARWGDGGPESIIAHEVGHAITLKCSDIFTASAGGDYEAFATAWAIGMGFTNPANGTTAYGRPSDELIAATMACR